MQFFHARPYVSDTYYTSDHSRKSDENNLNFAFTDLMVQALHTVLPEDDFCAGYIQHVRMFVIHYHI